jgi:hypothetical protein
MNTQEQLEKEIRTLEAEIKNLQIKKANVEIEIHSLDKRQINITNNIVELEQKRILAGDEYKQEFVKLQDIKKEAQAIKDNCRAEVDKVKKEWDDLAIESGKIKEFAKATVNGQEQLIKDRISLKEDAKKLVARQANLDQVQASLKTEKEKQENREKNLNKQATEIKDKDVQSLKDSTNLKAEAERLADIAKILDAKRLEFQGMQSLIQKRSNDLDLRDKELRAELKEVEELKAIWQDKVKEAEASKKQYSDAYAGLSQKEKEVEIARLRLIKIGKEKLTEETLRQLEKEANA